MSENLRKTKRVDTTNLISYIYRDEDGTITQQGIGRTLNVSQTGLLLETGYDVPLNSVIIMDIGIKDELVQAAGKVVYTKRGVNGKFESGIQFIKTTKKSFDLLKQYIRNMDDQNKIKISGLRGPVNTKKNLVMIISEEHKIIINYIVEFSRLLDDPDPEVFPIQTEILLENLSQDLVKHFNLEERVIFKSALLNNIDADIREKINDIQKEHQELLKHINPISKKVKEFAYIKQLPSQKVLTEIKNYFKQLKTHAKLEIETIFPYIAHNEEVKKTFIRLLMQHG